MIKVNEEAYSYISIAMATYNGARHLQSQLESFLTQTRQPDELVVCDDGSTDDTIDILHDFQTRAPFNVKIYCNDTNLGFTKNFEQALMKCSGNLIFLSDQDDVWFNSKLSVIEEAFLADKTKLLIVCDGNLVDENLKWYGVTALSQVQAGFGSADALVVGALTAMRKDFLNYALPIPEGIIGHDVWIHNLGLQLDARLVLSQPLQSIRRHSSNTSSWVASSVKKINKFDVFKSQYKTVASDGYEDRLIINKSMTSRLTYIFNNNYYFPKKIIEKNISFLKSERRAIRLRNRIPKANFFKRKLLALFMIIRGYYHYFNGYKSFLRDFFR